MQKAARKVALKAAKKAAVEATKTMTRITGSFNIILGVGFAIWDLLHLLEAQKRSDAAATSKLGGAFRILADEIENMMKNPGNELQEAALNDEGFAEEEA